MINVTLTGEFKVMENKLKSRKITDYEGENVESLSTDYLDDRQQLHDANAFDYQCTLDMLQEVMKAGGKDNVDFKHDLLSLENKLDKKLLEVRHKSMAEKHSALLKDELDVPSVLEACKDEYRKQIKQSWAPAVHAKDSKAISRSYGSVNLTNRSTKIKLENSLKVN